VVGTTLYNAWVRVVALLAMLGCGRIGFDPSGAGDDTDDPPARVDLDLTNCTIPSPLTLVRATPATYFDASGVLRTAPADKPRCAFDRATGEPRGVLVEPASTNYFDLARGDGVDFENLPQGWNADHDTGVMSNAVVTDSLTFLGYREVTITTSNSGGGGTYYQIRFDIDVPSGGDYTFSLYARSDMPAGITDFGFFGGYFTPNFQMSLGSEPSAVAPTPDGTWRRVWHTFTAPAGTGIIQAWLACSVGSNASYVVSLAAPQLEPGRHPTSPILTTGSPSSRDTDQIMTAAPELLAADAGTIVVDATFEPGVAYPRTVLEIGDGVPIHTVAHTTTAWTATRGGATITMAGPPDGRHRIGHRYDARGTALAVDTMLVPGAAVAPLGAATASFGAALDASGGLFGSISRIRTWPDALVDEMLLRATN
jgi:hypothetical protein